MATLVVNYLIKLDWSGLTVEKNAEVRRLSDDLALAEGSRRASIRPKELVQKLAWNKRAPKTG